MILAIQGFSCKATGVKEHATSTPTRPTGLKKQLTEQVLPRSLLGVHQSSGERGFESPTVHRGPGGTGGPSVPYSPHQRGSFLEPGWTHVFLIPARVWTPPGAPHTQSWADSGKMRLTERRYWKAQKQKGLQTEPHADLRLGTSRSVAVFPRMAFFSLVELF